MTPVNNALDKAKVMEAIGNIDLNQKICGHDLMVVYGKMRAGEFDLPAPSTADSEAETFTVLIDNGQDYSDWNVHGFVIVTQAEYDLMTANKGTLLEVVRAWEEEHEKWSTYEHEIEVFNLFLDSIGVAARARGFDQTFNGGGI